VTRDELERLAIMLEQGLDLSKEIAKRLVAHALKKAGGRRKHVAGCGFLRGERCSDGCKPDDSGPARPGPG
jgi:hypothetical protein